MSPKSFENNTPNCIATPQTEEPEWLCYRICYVTFGAVFLQRMGFSRCDSMSNTQHLESLSAERIREELEKILSSVTFHGSAAQAKLLRYLVEQSLEGNQESVKEYSIGVDALGRPDSFDPRRDNIVRVQAGRLRSRLARYYESEGLDDPVRIEFPKGAYTATFHTDGATPGISLTEANVEATVEASASYRDLFVHWKAAAIIVLALLATGAGVHYRRASAPSVSAPSVAVLPFLNRSDDKEGEVFSDGLTDELIDSLGKVPGLHVVARGSAFQFKDKTVDIRRIGPALNVRTVLEGSVRKYGDRLRITAELDDTTTGYRLWSESYDRELQDALAIQRDISQAIVDALGGQLAGKTAPSRESAIRITSRAVISGTSKHRKARRPPSVTSNRLSPRIRHTPEHMRGWPNVMP